MADLTLDQVQRLTADDIRRLTDNITEQDLALLNRYGFEYDPSKLGEDGRFSTLINALDPFIGTVQQTTRMRAFCQIMVNGVDITDKLKPHLISVKIYDGSPEKYGELEIDDRDGTMPLPAFGVPVFVALGWQSEQMVTVFKGVIDTWEHGFGRKQGGRRLYVHVKGLSHFDTLAKQPMQDHKGEGAPPGKKEGEMIGLPDWIQQMAKNSKVDANVSSVFNKIKQDSWHQAGESLMHTVQELGEKFGFIYQFSDGNKLDIKSIDEGGLSCYATWRDNLIAWRVRPLSIRSSFKGGLQQWFDKNDGHWNFAMQKFGLGFPFDAAAAENMPQTPAATETNAGNENSGQQAQADLQQGNGRIIINGEPRARWATHVLLTGARPGVDGLYFIKAVEHDYSRHGFITTLEVYPKANAPEQLNVSRGFLDLPRPQPNVG